MNNYEYESMPLDELKQAMDSAHRLYMYYESTDSHACWVKETKQRQAAYAEFLRLRTLYNKRVAEETYTLVQDFLNN